MLKAKGVPSLRVVEYFELVSSTTIRDYTNSPHDIYKNKACKEVCKTEFRDSIADMGPTLIPSLSALTNEQVTRVANTSIQSWKKVTVNSPTFLSQSPKIATLPLLTLFKLGIANSNFSNFFIIWKH